MNILLTGAYGFVGSAIRHSLQQQQKSVLSVTRQADKKSDQTYIINSIDNNTSWMPALKNIEVVVHTAARVHVVTEIASNPILEFRKTNVEGSLKLAQDAVSAGVKRFIFISSVKVNGPRS